MKPEDLMDAIGDARDPYVEQAGKPESHRTRWMGAIAACLAVLVGFWTVLGGFGGRSGGSGSSKGLSYMFYAGPVLPLTVNGDPSGLSAVRDITFDFSPYITTLQSDESQGETQTYEHYESNAWVTDSYVLRNETDEDLNAELLYPSVGTLSQPQYLPDLWVNGAKIISQMVPGPDSHSMDSEGNLPMKCFQDLRILLEGGTYQTMALQHRVPQDQPVTVYRLSNYVFDEALSASHAEAVIEFDVDPSKSGILCWGFNGMHREESLCRLENGNTILEDGLERTLADAYVIVLGQALEDYTIHTMERTEEGMRETDAFTCKVETYESTLCEILSLLVGDALESWHQREEIAAVAAEAPEKIPDEQLICSQLLELLEHYGWTEPHTPDRGIGMLEELCSVAMGNQRVLYQRFSVSVPAGESVTVEARIRKTASRNYTGRNREHEGYDLATTLDSNLTFTGQTARIVSADEIQIVDNNFGFDLEKNITEVALDSAVAHYWMTVRKK